MTETTQQRPQEELDARAAAEANALEAKLHKLRKVIPEGMPEDIEAMSEEELRQRITDCEVHMHEAEQAMEADDHLAALKEQVKEAAAPYKEVRKTQAAIAQYSAIQLIKMGKA